MNDNSKNGSQPLILGLLTLLSKLDKIPIVKQEKQKKSF